MNLLLLPSGRGRKDPRPFGEKEAHRSPASRRGCTGPVHFRVSVVEGAELRFEIPGKKDKSQPAKND